MALRDWSAPALLVLSVATALGQQSKPAPIVQPGAPGHRSKTLSASAAAPAAKKPADSDVSFMQGMIMHHAQAVEMVELLRTRGQSRELQSLGERISISQTDEIKYMKQWLEDRGKPTSMQHDMAAMKHDMKGMDHKQDAGAMLMPGMLSPEQMEALAKAKGAAFDELFLTGMIQHHTGALIMVDDLFNTAGAGQDAVLFDFATDIDNTQRAEINIMRGMLKEKK